MTGIELGPAPYRPGRNVMYSRISSPGNWAADHGTISDSTTPVGLTVSNTQTGQTLNNNLAAPAY